MDRTTEFLFWAWVVVPFSAMIVIALVGFALSLRGRSRLGQRPHSWGMWYDYGTTQRRDCEKCGLCEFK